MKYIKYIESFKSLNDETNNTYLNKPEPKFNKAQEIKDIFNQITFSDFFIQDLKYQTKITTSDNFKSCIIELNKIIQNPINPNIQFNAAIEYDNFNRVDFEAGIIDELKGLKIGYKIYIAMCRFYGYISTMDGVNPEAKNVWFSLVHDNNFYVIVNIKRTLLIDKNYTKIIELVNSFFVEYPDSDLDPELKNFLEL
jgi:hypothetical protein